MSTKPQIVKIALATHAYDIVIGNGLLTAVHDYIPIKAQKLALITDTHVEKNHLAPLLAHFESVGVKVAHHIIEAGESSKSFTHLQSLCDFLLDAQIERDDYIIALGGGVVGDLTGFAASIIRRGTRFIQIPTSLLAQVDSAIGGKTGINVKQGKNLIGAFHQPDLVLIDIDTLATLPPRHIGAGYAEIVKYGALGHRGEYGDFFEWLEAHANDILARQPAALTHAITESCRAKAAFVIDDERESGNRALLNLGHTFAHAFETLTAYDGSLLHGEAVSLGLCLAFDFSVSLGLCPQSDATRLRALLKAAELPTQISDCSKSFATQDIMAAMQQDKKVKHGRLRFILTRGLGDCFIEEAGAPATLVQFLDSQNG
ncbi:MAG: 3-dehydroquinate synthase [Alphaproteobacteria bacterium]|nr:3-dehydroquinate synthase [Alphaproteobacteria bacterium]